MISKLLDSVPEVRKPHSKATDICNSIKPSCGTQNVQDLLTNNFTACSCTSSFVCTGHCVTLKHKKNLLISDYINRHFRSSWTFLHIAIIIMLQLCGYSLCCMESEHKNIFFYNSLQLLPPPFHRFHCEDE